MQLLFVDGIGGSRLLRGGLLRRLEQAGHEATHFSYLTASANFTAIYSNLAGNIRTLAARGEYAMIGYSFGGVLIRAALQHSLQGISPPKHLFLLGSPIRSLKLSRGFRTCVAYRILTGDSGQVVASPQRMREIALPTVPTTCIVGTKPIRGLSRFVKHRTSNDGLVSISEACPHRFTDAEYLRVSHPWLPDSLQALSIVLNRLNYNAYPVDA